MVLRAKDIMEASFLSLDGKTDALSAAKVMAEQHKGYAVITTEGGAHVKGIVTEWDYLAKVVAGQMDPSRVLVEELASSVLQSCSPETPTDEVVATMASLGIRRMVVRSGDKVVGVITAKNILASFRPYVDKLSSEIAGYQSSPTPLG